MNKFGCIYIFFIGHTSCKMPQQIVSEGTIYCISKYEKSSSSVCSNYAYKLEQMMPTMTQTPMGHQRKPIYASPCKLGYKLEQTTPTMTQPAKQSGSIGSTALTCRPTVRRSAMCCRHMPSRLSFTAARSPCHCFAAIRPV